jgi:uncharacterized protein YbjT (DUF2867 family)
MTTVLVTGATGNVGSAVVRELAGRGVSVRAFVRNLDAARERLGEGVDLAVGDLSDPASIRGAMTGVDRVFLSSADGPQKPDHEIAVIDAAAASGEIELLVKASTIGAEAGATLPSFDWHGRVEAHLRATGVPAVILHSCFYMTNLLAAAEPVRTQSMLFAPAGGGKLAMVDPRDTGAVGAAVVASGDHVGATLTLTGSETLTHERIAEELSAATGRAIRYVDVPPEAARQGFVDAGMPGWLVDQLDGVFGLIRAGALEEVTDTVRAVTGREPCTFNEFARDHAAAFSG